MSCVLSERNVFTFIDTDFGVDERAVWSEPEHVFGNLMFTDLNFTSTSY